MRVQVDEHAVHPAGWPRRARAAARGGRRSPDHGSHRSSRGRPPAGATARPATPTAGTLVGQTRCSPAQIGPDLRRSGRTADPRGGGHARPAVPALAPTSASSAWRRRGAPGQPHRGHRRLRRLHQRRSGAGVRRPATGDRTGAHRGPRLRLDRAARARRGADVLPGRSVRPARTGRRGRGAGLPATEDGHLRQLAVPGAQDGGLRRAHRRQRVPDRPGRGDHDLPRPGLHRHRPARRALAAAHGPRGTGGRPGESWPSARRP